MSEQSIQSRAAAIRRTWTRKQHVQRAITSDQRCLDLLVRIAVGARQGTTWSSRKPA